MKRFLSKVVAWAVGSWLCCRASFLRCRRCRVTGPWLRTGPPEAVSLSEGPGWGSL